MTRQRQVIPLEVIEIATPCHASWDQMRGNDRVRFCQACSLHVYDISAMSRIEATELVSQHEGRLCVQMYRRADGTVITDDCGRIRKAARRAATVAVMVGSTVLCAALSPLFLLNSNHPAPRTPQASFMPVEMFERCLAPLAKWFSMNRARGEVSVQAAGGICAPSTQRMTGDVALPATQPLKGKVAPTTAPIQSDR